MPVAIEERNQLCFGVWATVGSTGRWPEVVNMWELDGWDGLVDNFEPRVRRRPRAQDPSLAEWWAVAASLRRGGVDRIVVPEPWTRPIEALIADGVRGEVYCHELVPVPPGAAPDFLAAFREVAVPAHEAFDLDLVGAFRVAMVNDSEAIVIWAVPDWATWAGSSRPGSDRATTPTCWPAGARRPSTSVPTGSAACSSTPRWPRCASAASRRSPTAAPSTSSEGNRGRGPWAPAAVLCQASRYCMMRPSTSACSAGVASCSMP